MRGVILLLCIVSALGPALTRAECRTYWTGFGKFCYRHFGTGKSWMAANRHCQNLRSNLTSIHTPAENNFLYNYWRTSISTPNKGFWIGLNDKEKETCFDWDDGTPYTYNKFLRGEPSNTYGVENCVAMRYRSIMSDFEMAWDALPCHYRLSFICKRDK